MNIKGLLLSSAIALGAVSGCATSTESATSTLLNAFSAEAAGPVSGSVSFTAKGGVGSLATKLELPLTSAPLRLELTEKTAELTSLSIPLGDLMVSKGALPPNGLHIRNLALTVDAASAVIDARTTDAVAMHTRAPVELAWEMEVSPGEFYPLAPVKIAGLDFEIGLVESNGENLLSVDARCAGSCWALPGIVDVSDVALHFDAPVTLHISGASLSK